jgi:hypothetical protein
MIIFQRKGLQLEIKVQMLLIFQIIDSRKKWIEISHIENYQVLDSLQQLEVIHRLEFTEVKERIKVL